MTAFEILTIILTAFSGVVAVSAILVPIILNYLTKREENKMKRPINLDKVQYSKYKLKYMNLVDELTLNFSKYATNLDDKAMLLSTIYKLTILSEDYLKILLNDLLKEVQSKIFDFNKLNTKFTNFLQEIDETRLHTFWYGAAFDASHKDLYS